MSRHALVVGINRYDRLKPLHLPAGDAEAIARVLEDLGDFRVDRLPERIHDGRPALDPGGRVTKFMLEQAILRLFLPEGGPAPDTALLFVAGHGLQVRRGVAEGYLAAWDTGPDGELGVPLQWLRRILKESAGRPGGTKSQIVWLDTCHSGALLDFGELDPGTPNRCLIAASRAFELAYEETAGGHGVLTGALLEALDPGDAPDGLVTNRTLAARIDRLLRRETQHCLIENAGDAIALTRAPAAGAETSTLPATGARGHGALSAGGPGNERATRVRRGLRQRTWPIALVLAAATAAAITLAVRHWSPWEDPALAASLAEGRAYLDTGRYDRALALYQAALAANPDSADIRYGRDKAAILAGAGPSFDPEDAGLKLRTLGHSHPRDPHIQVMLGRLAASAGNLAEAQARFRQATELDPNQAEAWFGLGVLAQESGRPDEALDDYRQADELAPHHRVYATNLAGLHLARGDYTAALALYEGLLAGSPDLLLARLDAGNAARLAGDLARASAHHERLLQSLQQGGIFESGDNAAQWVFDLSGVGPNPERRATMDTPDSKRAYSLLAVSLTRFLRGDRAGAQALVDRAAGSPEIERALAVLADDLLRLSRARPELAEAVAGYRGWLIGLGGVP